MNEYKHFSYYFDQIMEFMDYEAWVDFTMQNIKEGSSILDLACGSGLFLMMMNNYGYPTDGLDLSSEMISLANDKIKACHIPCNLYTMDMTNFKLDKTYDVITCYFDSINHLPTIEMVHECMNTVYNHLNKDGLFLFDVFSYSRYTDTENTDVHEDFDDFSYDWKMSTEAPNILHHDLRIKGLESFEEKYNEYYYDYKEFIDLTKFEIIKIVGDFQDDLQDEDERILIVLKKK